MVKNRYVLVCCVYVAIDVRKELPTTTGNLELTNQIDLLSRSVIILLRSMRQRAVVAPIWQHTIPNPLASHGHQSRAEGGPSQKF